MKKTATVILVLIGVLSSSCHSGVDREYIKSLHPTPVPHSLFELSIPDNYSIEETQGPDFNVYYLQPSDTNNKKLFTAGIYLGNNPSKFRKMKTGCKMEKRVSKVLESKNEWTVYDCSGQFFLETIVENKYSQGGDDFIHLFGNATKESDVANLIAIFSTLIKKK